MPVGCIGLGRIGGLPRNVQCLGGKKENTSMLSSRPVAVVAPFNPDRLCEVRGASTSTDTGNNAESSFSSSFGGNSLDVFHVHMHIKGEIGVKFYVKRNKLYIHGELIYRYIIFGFIESGLMFSQLSCSKSVSVCLF